MSRAKLLDLSHRRHSHLYELKPLSRWWLAVLVPWVFLNAYLNGFTDWRTWALVLSGFACGMAWLLIFPRLNLTKRD